VATPAQTHPRGEGTPSAAAAPVPADDAPTQSPGLRCSGLRIRAAGSFSNGAAEAEARPCNIKWGTDDRTDEDGEDDEPAGVGTALGSVEDGGGTGSNPVPNAGGTSTPRFLRSSSLVGWGEDEEELLPIAVAQ